MEENFRKAFSRNLKYYMAREGKSQADMVKYMKVSSATASDWCNERKIPRADKLQSLCNWLGITLSELTSEDDPFDRSQPRDEGYYSEQVVKRIANKLKEDSDYRALFEAASNVRREDLEVVTQIIRKFT